MESAIAGYARLLVLVSLVFADVRFVNVRAQQQAPVPFHARVLSAGELASTRVRLDKRLVPRMAAPLQVDPKQVFALERGGKVWMVVEPVRYDSYDTEVPTHTSFRCGVFLLPAEGAATFLPTLGYGNYEPVQCTALKAVRFKYPKGRTAPPRIEMSYEGSTPNATSEQYVVFSWNAAKKAYIEDDSLQ